MFDIWPSNPFIFVSMKYLFSALFLTCVLFCSAQTAIIKQDQQISQMVEEVSEKNIEANINSLQCEINNIKIPDIIENDISSNQE